jgi:hypothetical protein
MTRTRIQEVTRDLTRQVTAEVTVGLTHEVMARLVQVVYPQVSLRLTRRVSLETKTCLSTPSPGLAGSRDSVRKAR